MHPRTEEAEPNLKLLRPFSRPPKPVLLKLKSKNSNNINRQLKLRMLPKMQLRTPPLMQLKLLPPLLLVSRLRIFFHVAANKTQASPVVASLPHLTIKLHLMSVLPRIRPAVKRVPLFSNSTKNVTSNLTKPKMLLLHQLPSKFFKLQLTRLKPLRC